MAKRSGYIINIANHFPSGRRRGLPSEGVKGGWGAAWRGEVRPSKRRGCKGGANGAAGSALRCAVGYPCPGVRHAVARCVNGDFSRRRRATPAAAPPRRRPSDRPPRAFGGNAPKIKNRDVSRPAWSDIPPQRRNGVKSALKRQLRPLRPWLRPRRSPWAGRKAPHPKGGACGGQGETRAAPPCARHRGVTPIRHVTRNSLGTTVLVHRETEM